jgi:polysaccharide biosynthesis protein PslH
VSNVLRILFLTQIIPYPPDAGPKVKTWQVIQYLINQGHEVILASFVRPGEEVNLPELKKICSEVYTVPIRRSRIQDVGYLLRSYLTGRPFLIERDDLPGMRKLVNRLIAEKKIDVIHADQLTMTQFALVDRRIRPGTIFDAHNAVWTIVDRSAATAAWFLKIPLHIEARRVQNYEAMLVDEFDCTLAVTEIDRNLLIRGNGKGDPKKRITVIPIVVDTQKLPPATRNPNSLNILTLGTLHYPPNADGIRWFLQEVFPLVQSQVKDVKLIVIGKNPPDDFIQIAARDPNAVEITGYVTELAPYFDNASVVVVPVRAGGGMRVRILEAFSRAMPVVTTSVGLEGIEAVPGKDVLVEDSPAAFAEAVIRLLQDKALRDSLAENGRNLAVTRYDWQVVLGQLGKIYAKFS